MDGAPAPFAKAGFRVEMSIDGLKQWLEPTPFKPFVVRLTNGREVRVQHPELVARSPTGRTIIVYTTGDAFEMVDLLHVASIVRGNGKRRLSGEWNGKGRRS
jgi:hypothetical protein